MACLEAGASRSQGAPPLVLLHGIGADHGEWALTLPLFARGRRVLAMDLLGHPLVALAAALYKGRRRNRPQLMKLVASMAAGEDAVKPRDLARIPNETLVLWGDRDRIFPLAAGRRLVRGLPNARLEILPRCGHVPPTERPVAFARRVLAFLDPVSSRARGAQRLKKP